MLVKLFDKTLRNEMICMFDVVEYIYIYDYIDCIYI